MAEKKEEVKVKPPTVEDKRRRYLVLMLGEAEGMKAWAEEKAGSKSKRKY